MDTLMLRKLKPQVTPVIDALPTECPLSMPEQSLRSPASSARRPGPAAGRMAVRRSLLLVATFLLTALGAYEMYAVLEVGGLTLPETAILVLFVLLFSWIAFSFSSATFGFLSALTGTDRALGVDPKMPLPRLRSRTALLLPTYNEDPGPVMARLQATQDSIGETGQEERFDFFVLSDTTDPAVWIAEESAFLRLRNAAQNSRIFYRHRSSNVGRKAGNIADWVRRFGGRYDFMIVLDADSLMEGDTVIRLAGAMEQNPDAGLIQSLPVLLNGDTLFARLQQFANRVYGPLIACGFAWWHGAESNYWGHNAIIRVKAFAQHAGLPSLRGRKPFGGHIMSHDFVEAALLRRAGWGVHLVTNLRGSYEECPPTLTDYAARDRRWCQGNLQHIAVLPARGLHWVSRLHLLTGIGCYATAPVWLLFLLLGILISLQAQFVRPDYFPAGATLFPQWPAQDPIRAAWVFVGTMALLVVPKLYGYLAAIMNQGDRAGIGGAIRGGASVVLETFISALIAPIMMLMQSKAVAEILLGRDSGWAAQRRTHEGVSTSELVHRYGIITLLGLALAAGAFAVSLPLLLWMLPVILGLVLAIPIVALTSHASVGRRLRRAGLFLTPEERRPPDVLHRAGALARERGRGDTGHPLLTLLSKPDLLTAHLQMLPAPATRRRGEIDGDLVVALAKIELANDRSEAVEFLSDRETFAVLRSRDALDRLTLKP